MARRKWLREFMGEVRTVDGFSRRSEGGATLEAFMNTLDRNLEDAMEIEGKGDSTKWRAAVEEAGKLVKNFAAVAKVTREWDNAKDTLVAMSVGPAPQSRERGAVWRTLLTKAHASYRCERLREGLYSEVLTGRLRVLLHHVCDGAAAREALGRQSAKSDHPYMPEGL
mmetsp:Transcript_61918/g.146606  ORF Transcript_61918/g.146606 Transcript_61918/m.146606 type:complete len:168 (+) Transcript_61918:512-1015(+)